MKTLVNVVNESKKTTGEGSIEMIDTIISELRKNKSKEILKSAQAFLTDYLNELTDDDIQYIIDVYGIEDFKIGSDRQAIANYIAYKAELHKK